MTRPLPRPVDSLLLMLGRSADRSVLWVTLARAFAWSAAIARRSRIAISLR